MVDERWAWSPRTAEELRAALESGLLEETHVLDLKRELGKSASANKKLAADIAAFSVDGGTIIIGVEETEVDGKKLGAALYPIPLAGLAERVEQIGLSAVHEPVQVQCHSLPESDGGGYLVVEVPASARAPHQADGRFYGRSDKTNMVLDPQAVFRIHQARLASQRNAASLAQTVLDAAPTPAGRFSRGILCIVATPANSTRELLATESARPDWRGTYAELFRSALNGYQNDFSPTLTEAGRVERRPGGVGWPVNLDESRQARPNRDFVECFAGDDGRIELVSSRVADNRLKDPEQSMMLALDSLIVGNAVYVARLAGHVSQQARFRGSWNLAMICTGLQGASSARLHTDFSASASTYTADDYRREVTASSEELLDSPAVVAGDLVMPLLRALQSDWIDDWQDLKRPPP